MLIPPLTFPNTIIPSSMSFSPFATDDILIYHQSLESYRPSRMYPSRADTNFSPKSIPEAICEACAGIHECSGTIDRATEEPPVLRGLGENHVGVVGGVRVYEADCVSYGRDGVDGEDEVEEFSVVVD